MKSWLILAVFSLILTVGVTAAYSQMDSSSVTVLDDGVDISGIIKPDSKATLNIWNESGKLVYEESLMPEAFGHYRLQIGEEQLGGAGIFHGELIHEEQTLTFGGFGTGDKSTQASQDTINVEVRGDSVNLSGAAKPNTESTLNIWNESGKLVYEELLVIEDWGHYEIRLDGKQLGGDGIFDGEITNGGETITFTFTTVNKSTQAS